MRYTATASSVPELLPVTEFCAGMQKGALRDAARVDRTKVAVSGQRWSLIRAGRFRFRAQLLLDP